MEIKSKKLINLVKQRPALYDPKCRQYTDKTGKGRLWDEICAELIKNWHTLERDEKIKLGRGIQKRWNNLRDCFRRELKYQKKFPNGSRRKYMYYDNLLFLLPHSKTSKSKRSSEDEDANFTPTTQYAERGHTEQSHQATKDTDVTPTAHYDEHENTEQSYQVTKDTDVMPTTSYADHEHMEQSDQPTKHSSTNLSNKRKKKKRTSLSKNVVHILKKRLISHDRRSVVDDDECFLMSLLPSFKKYDYEKKIMLRMEILSTVFKFERSQNSNKGSMAPSNSGDDSCYFEPMSAGNVTANATSSYVVTSPTQQVMPSVSVSCEDTLIIKKCMEEF